MIGLDIAIFRFFNSHHSAIFDAFFWGCSTFGSAWVIVPAFTIFILFAAGRRRLGIILVASGICLISGAILTEVIKNGVSRPRPAAYFEAEGTTAPEGGAARPFDVHVVGRRLAGDNSFPSGHSWAAFAIATLMALFFGRKYGWVYLAAAAIAYSRIYVGVHFPVDVIGGAIGGTLMAFFAWRVTAWISPEQARPAKT